MSQSNPFPEGRIVTESGSKNSDRSVYWTTHYPIDNERKAAFIKLSENTNGMDDRRLLADRNRSISKIPKSARHFSAVV